MNLTGLRYFVALAEIASFTRAAQRLNVTQPTLSTAIARLEDQLGSRLFDRDRRRAALTPAGERLLARARTILGEWRDAQAELRAAGTPRPRLRLGMLPTLPASAAVAYPARLAERHGIELELHEGNPSVLAGRLLQGSLDIALTRIDEKPEGLASLFLARESYRLGVAATHILAARDSCSVRDLADMPFLLRARCEVLEQARATFAAHGVRPRVLLRSTREEHVGALVAAGMGACFLPESLARSGMALLAIDELPFTRRLGLMWRTDLAPALVEAAGDGARDIRWQAFATPDLDFAH